MEQLGANIPYPPATVEASRERLFGAGLEFMPNMMLGAITATHVEMRGLGNNVVRTFPSDTVVLAGYHEPNCGLADALAGQSFGVHLAGNVNGTSSIQAALHSAAAIARGL
jgi:hypothetical protein